jgi:hypothetical protein
MARRLGHVDRDKREQKHQNGSRKGQNDRDHRDDFLDRIDLMGGIVVGVGIRMGHGRLSNQKAASAAQSRILAFWAA